MKTRGGGVSALLAELEVVRVGPAMVGVPLDANAADVADAVEQ